MSCAVKSLWSIGSGAAVEGPTTISASSAALLAVRQGLWNVAYGRKSSEHSKKRRKS